MFFERVVSTCEIQMYLNKAINKALIQGVLNKSGVDVIRKEWGKLKDIVEILVTSWLFFFQLCMGRFQVLRDAAVFYTDGLFEALSLIKLLNTAAHIHDMHGVMLYIIEIRK